MSHFPGPWRENGSYIEADNGPIGHTHLIAFIKGSPDDASLIAAAPELLAVCERAEKLLNFDDVEHKYLSINLHVASVIPVLSSLRDILLKAGGMVPGKDPSVNPDSREP